MGTKSEFISIVGRTNAGKSSLLNLLLGEKIAIVTDKPQTTRTKITGVVTKGKTQYVFIDTPGVHRAKNKLSEHMLKTVRESEKDVDAILYVVDCSCKTGDTEKDIIGSFNSKTPIILILNKIDLISKEQLMLKIAEMSQLYDFAAVIPASMTQKSGIGDIWEEINKYAEESPHFFADDTLTDQTERVIAAEIIREKLMTLLDEEVPHGIAVTVEEMKERDDKDLLDISANIFCEKESHKGIVIGKGGAMLKKVGVLAREDLESFFEIKVNLKLWVKVKEDWRNREGLIKNFGLDFKK